MSHLFVFYLHEPFIRFCKYYTDVLSTEDILVVNNLLTKS